MRGPLDESHIIRTIEYWDVERRRFPAYEHVPVVVAEDITSRFLNVLSLFSGSIPLVALQMSALQLDSGVVLHFVKVLDHRNTLRDDDTVAGPQQPVDRAFWVAQAAEASVGLAETFLQSINAASSSKHELNYNRQYIGLAVDGRPNNFVVFRPRKKMLLVDASLDAVDEVRDTFEREGIDAKRTGEEWIRVKIPIPANDTAKQLAGELVKASARYHEG